MTTEEIREKIEREVKSTVGFKEAENKEAFMVGVSVAISKAEEIYEKALEDLRERAKLFEKSYDTVCKDMHTLCEIINRYSNIP